MRGLQGCTCAMHMPIFVMSSLLVWLAEACLVLLEQCI